MLRQLSLDGPCCLCLPMISGLDYITPQPPPVLTTGQSRPWLGRGQGAGGGGHRVERCLPSVYVGTHSRALSLATCTHPHLAPTSIRSLCLLSPLQVAPSNWKRKHSCPLPPLCLSLPSLPPLSQEAIWDGCGLLKAEQPQKSRSTVCASRDTALGHHHVDIFLILWAVRV